MASNSTPPPLHLSTQELKNAAAGVVSEQASLPRPLRSSQSFRLDEGYSGQETPIVYDEANGQDLRAVREGVDFKIPPWMAGLNDALREEYAYKLIRTLPTSRIASLVDRLVPILYLDFVQMLPPELSLQILSYLPVRSLLNASLASRTWRRFALEPRLWKGLYEVQGWRSNETEILRLENKLREEPEDGVRQQMEVKRKAEDQKDEEKNLRDIARRNSQRFRNSAERVGVGRSSGSNSPAAMDATTQEWPSQTTISTEVDMNNITQSTEGLDMSFYSNAPHNSGSRPGQAASFKSDPTVPDDEEILSTYPGAPKTLIPQATYQELPLPVEPTLIVPGYGYLRINWAFLFKYRKRLEDNWIHNRYSTFQIPHPDFPAEGHAECIYTIQYSPNYLVSGSRDRTVRVWDIKTRRLRGKPLEGHVGSVLCLQFDESPDEDILITGSSDDRVIIWRFSTGEKIRTIEKAHQESVLNLKFSKKWLVTCSKDRFIKVWNRQQLETLDKDYPWHSKLLFGNGQEVRNHPHHPGSRRVQAARVVQDPAASSGSGLRNPYASGGFVGAGAPPKSSAKTLPPYTAVQVLIGHAAAVNAIQLHGDQIASASGDRLIKLWNLRTGTCEKTYVGHTKGIACIQFDGHTIVSGSSDQTIRVFDGRTQAEIATLAGHRALVRTVQATENRIVSGSYDETVRIWRKDIDGQWTDSHVLRQGGPENHHPRPAHHAVHPMMPGNPQQGTIPQAPIPQAAIQMHQVHTVGPALAGAVAAAQLLPNHHHHFHHQPQPPPPPPQTQAQQQQMPPAHPIPATSGTHRIFKLQFDARWIICCSQDSKIIGWDFAAGDPGIIEASRFFEGGN
ncbi:WD40 repeat-like protein [Tuber magnatum]|uniref:WD40 repeat-like protein n=1 Tax=Tuber magnatum TaxID=42249 RepID=A0A317SLI1_9PEZI|nr:WD40 repeat-like protein [Tuber magnatum]